MASNPYAPNEQEVMDSLRDAWNGFVGLIQTHPDDTDDFRKAIHRCQSVMMGRVMRREYPDIHPSHPAAEHDREGEGVGA